MDTCPLIPEIKSGDIIYIWDGKDANFFWWSPSQNKLFYLALGLPHSPIWVDIPNLMLGHVHCWRVIHIEP